MLGASFTGEIEILTVAEEEREPTVTVYEKESSPLRSADDSVTIDTSNLDPNAVLKEIKKYF